MSGAQRPRNSNAVDTENGKKQILGKDTLLTSLVFNSLDNSYSSIALYNGMRNVSHDFRTTVDLNMRPVCVDGTMQPFCDDTSLPMLYQDQNTPFVVTHFHDKGQTTTYDLLAPLLYLNGGSVETQADSDKNAYVRMTLLYTHEPAVIDIFRLLSGLQATRGRFMRFVDAIGTITPDEPTPFMADLLLWMKTHRNNASIQQKGFSLMQGFDFDTEDYLDLHAKNAPIFWCRVADAMSLHFDAPNFKQSLFSLLFSPDDNYDATSPERDLLVYKSQSGGLACAVAVTVVCCDMIQRFFDFRLDILRPIIKILSIVCAWRIKEFAELPECTRLSVFIARLLVHTESEDDCQYYLFWATIHLVDVSATMAFKCGLLQSAVRATKLCMEKSELGDEIYDFDIEEYHQVIVAMVHAIALWVDTDPLYSDFLIEHALLFISNIITNHVLDDSALDTLLKTTPDDISKILRIVPVHAMPKCQEILQSHNIVNLIMQMITRAFVRLESNPVCVAWMYCLCSIIEDNPAGQEEAIKNSIILVIKSVFGKRWYYQTECQLPATALFFLLMTQSFNKIPASINKLEFVVRASRAISERRNIPEMLVHRSFEFCDEMRKRQYLGPAQNCTEEILCILSSILKKKYPASNNGSARQYSLQEHVITKLAQMAIDDPLHEYFRPRNLQTARFKLLKTDGAARSAKYDANMGILSRYFKIKR